MACILWFAGCNMRCGYCYNPSIVKGKGQISYEEALAFIATRKHLLDGVVFSGGECTLHPGLVNLAWVVKDMGLKVKVDTNGSKPGTLEELVKINALDYVSLDFKSMPAHFYQVTRSRVFAAFSRSLELLLQVGIDMEIRTTVHSCLFTPAQIHEMVAFLEKAGYRGDYYLQHFVGDSPTLEELPASVKKDVTENFSIEGIKVSWRN
jgi:pyruvate formate lyase activating enzyme